MHRFSLEFGWADPDTGACGRETIKLAALQPRKHYGDLGDYPGIKRIRAREAKRLAFSARSLVAFMDVTGLRSSEAWSDVFQRVDWGREDRRGLPLRPSGDQGFDHTRLWRTADKRYVVTTEPYNTGPVDRAKAWCAAQGWPCEAFPPFVGFWNPDGEQGTLLLMMSPLVKGAPIAQWIPELMEKLPRGPWW